MFNNVIPKVAILISELTVLTYDIYIFNFVLIVDVVNIFFTTAQRFNSVYIFSRGKIKETFLSSKRNIWCILLC